MLIKFLLRSAISDYEADRLEDAARKLVEITESDDPPPDAFEYLYLIEKHDRKNLSEAQRWAARYVDRVRSLADSGNREWRRKLAYMRQYGDRIKIDESKSLEEFQRLAEEGDAESQYHLSTLYAKGKCGLAANNDMYIMWLELAVSNGFPDAQYDLANIILSQNKLRGDDCARARNLLHQSAKAGFKMSEEALARLEEKRHTHIDRHNRSDKDP